MRPFWNRYSIKNKQPDHPDCSTQYGEVDKGGMPFEGASLTAPPAKEESKQNAQSVKVNSY